MELLLLVLLAVPSATGIKELALDMAPNSFDDQYRGCSDKMLKVLPVLNRPELTLNSVFARGWVSAAASWNKSLGSLQQQDRGITLLAHTLQWELPRQFNAAGRVAGRSRRIYLRDFPFRVLHFLLTEALDDLRDAQTHPRCLHVSRGVPGIRFTAQPGDIVRFGQFTSASLNKGVIERFGTDTTFEVHTCHGARIRDFSNYPNEEEVLIPPFETFNVTSVTRRGDKPHIQLRSLGVHSKHNCALCSGRSIPRDPQTSGGSP
ncbi:erythroblast NAD(P)(+)--arginine ADP-ribosyltransferase-like [Chiroxiphia lanceolata]|uniref:erythroblast NAD(P)(+)--arginine ADP-ribosyltransferase-like n=1 Tax=Chiroxiphia lanceolata TaxID=296741 RepID=UPI0013CF18BB|nr:erythroblast NAD(P)(+)--arginine ADP-ribosyltransferase-like [Chiroxiphia lanceolata]